MALLWMLLGRELRLLLGGGGAAWLGAALAALILFLPPFALGAEPERLAPLGPALAWIAALLGLLLPIPRLVAEDAADGTLARIALAERSFFTLALAKMLAVLIALGLPVALTALLGAAAYGVSATTLLVLAQSFALGLPSLAWLAVFAAATAAGARAAALLILLTVLPLAIPVLIFAGGAIAAAEIAGPTAQPLYWLAAILGFQTALAWPLSVLALRQAL